MARAWMRVPSRTRAKPERDPDWSPTISPHRSYRRFVRGSRVGLVYFLGLLAVLEAAVLVERERLARTFSQTALDLVPGHIATLSGDRYAGTALEPLRFEMKVVGYQELLIWVVAGLLIAFLVVATRRARTPLFLILGYNAFLAAGGALYLLLVGRLGYEAFEFSQLYLRTNLIIWFVLPLLTGALALLLPFNPIERFALVALGLAAQIVMSCVRYAVFAWVLNRTGPMLMANMYLFFGPLLDFVYLTGLYSILLVRLGNRLARGRGRELAWL